MELREARVWAVEGRVRAVECRVWAVDGRVWAVEGRVWAVEGRVWAMVGREYSLSFMRLELEPHAPTLRPGAHPYGEVSDPLRALCVY